MPNFDYVGANNGNVSIVYIGPKKFKTVNRQTFRQYHPVPVPEPMAANLLKFPDVFIEESQLEDFKKNQAEKMAEAEAKAKEQEAALEAEKLARDMTVTVGGKEYDLNKMTISKIKTLLESGDIENAPTKDSQESAQEYKVKIRDFLREMPSEPVED
ncbi:hypothetical protein [Vibrio salinus]|uniref:hypothetical protein n=1 Tax=Vibrio salinus TaxID=2899784 RepID=UPI001E35A20B|nr:hypothetical protein [Vibrio salinus]MCE0495772.1 hypothetical protein [Vibrio salinus]